MAIDSQRGDNLDALLARWFDRNLPHRQGLALATLSTGHWLLMIDVGQRLLEREFPTGLKQGPLQNVPFIDYTAANNWLWYLWQKLKLAVGTEEPQACC
jgi:hypothetical protein